MEVVFTSEVTFIEVHSHLLFVPGGDVHRWGASLARELEGLIHELAPPNQSEARWGTWSRGFLQTTIFGRITEGAGNTLNIDGGARAPYAKFVHEGTEGIEGYIYTTAGASNVGVVDSWVDNRQFRGSAADREFWMPITRIPGKTQYVLRVRGQKANPFVTNAYRVLRGRHSSLPRL